jgi:hypothetical protein
VAAVIEYYIKIWSTARLRNLSICPPISDFLKKEEYMPNINMKIKISFKCGAIYVSICRMLSCIKE